MNIKYRKLHLITFGKGDAFDSGKFERIANRDFVKPSGGLWASPVDARFGWREWCNSETFGNLKSQFEFYYSGNVMRIDSLADVQQMPYRKVFGKFEYPDFEAIERTGIDAIWLTERGEQQTRFSFPRNLYGWDCECVLVMNPAGVLMLAQSAEEDKLSEKHHDTRGPGSYGYREQREEGTNNDGHGD